MARAAARRRSGERVWVTAFAVAAAGCGVALGLNLWLSELRPGTAWSIGYGVAAAVLAVGAASFGLRRRFARTATRLGAGRASAWLGFHVWGGMLFALLVLLHTGFRLPSGWVTWGLWLLSLWTVVSGVVGRLLQRWIPRVLASGLATEVLYERVPELTEQIRERSAAIAAAAGEAVRSLYDRGLASELERPRRRWIFFLDITGGLQARLGEFALLRPLLAAEERQQLDDLERLFRTKLEIDAHYTLQWPLRWWLAAHLPASIVLLVFLLLHLYTVLFY